MVLFLHRTALALAEVLLAVARTGERAHAAIFALANLTSSLQQARACCVYVPAQNGIAAHCLSVRRLLSLSCATDATLT